ncbi:hypothetical protein B566_EDAN010401 [Ephemera danica]|nr:hypothetical protein B566_EDAN010401 [Ephemera danica]
MAATSITISEILKSTIELEDEPKKKSREDWRKAKELEEARKAGTAPAAVDEEGRDINPHIPQYISSAPWYFGSKGPTLKHQRPQPEKQKTFSTLDEWYKRGVDASKVVTKFRKGSCENCGAMTHKRKDCMERPRKVGAKFTGQAIASDEFSQPNLAIDYDGKRDRWNGYDPTEHRAIIEEFQKVEDAKRQLKAEKLKGAGEEGQADTEEAEEGETQDDDKYVDEVDMPGTKVDSKQRITVRNLRIREDTAKYLRNLDPNSAYYDPKTRSMRDNPNSIQEAADEDEEYAGENFVRFSGDTRKHARAQLFAWEAYGKGVDVHLLAEPTKLELLQKEYEGRKDDYKTQAQASVLAKYGGEEHLKAPPKALLLAQTENYTEYSRHGRVIKGQDKPVVRSRYEEDQLLNNHNSVWGSYWEAGQWGYKCCHSFVKNSYCVGEAGKTADPEEGAPGVTEEIRERLEPQAGTSKQQSDSEDEKRREKRKQKKLKKKQKKKLQKEKKKQRKLAAAAGKVGNAREDEDAEADERKRKYNSMYEVKAPTEEEMENYFKKRRHFEDPMAQFM